MSLLGQHKRLAVGKDSHDDAGAISCADVSQHSLEGWKGTGPSRRILGRICTMLTGHLSTGHSLSGNTDTSFLGQWPCRSQPSQYTPDWLRFTQGIGCLFGRIDQARNRYHYVPIGYSLP